MRPIEFRGWSKDLKGVVYGYYLIDVDEHIIVCKNKGVYHEVDPESVGQYTGLKDKNGKRIFEGDIVKGDEYYNGDSLYKWYPSQIKYDDGGYYIDCVNAPELDSCEVHNCNIEIIGTIYENKELLGEG